MYLAKIDEDERRPSEQRQEAGEQDAIAGGHLGVRGIHDSSSRKTTATNTTKSFALIGGRCAGPGGRCDRPRSDSRGTANYAVLAAD